MLYCNMYHRVSFSSSGAHTNFRYNYLEYCTSNFVETHIVLKLKCSIIILFIISFYKMINHQYYSEKITFKLVN